VAFLLPARIQLENDDGKRSGRVELCTRERASLDLYENDLYENETLKQEIEIE
jgi:hypothetical protein